MRRKCIIVRFTRPQQRLVLGHFVRKCVCIKSNSLSLLVALKKGKQAEASFICQRVVFRDKLFFLFFFLAQRVLFCCISQNAETSALVHLGFYYKKFLPFFHLKK